MRELSKVLARILSKPIFLRKTFSRGAPYLISKVRFWE